MSEPTTECAMQGPLDSSQRRPIAGVTGVDPSRLSEQARRTLDWLSGWDAPTAAGIVEVLHATRTESKKPRLRASVARSDADVARYDGRWGLAR